MPPPAIQQQDETPPWEQYQPATQIIRVYYRDKNGAVIGQDDAEVLVLDQRAEFQCGLRPNTLGHRLRLNGVAEVALKRMVDLMQRPDVSDKIAFEASRFLLAHAHGNAIPIERNATQTQILIVNNIDASDQTRQGNVAIEIDA